MFSSVLLFLEIFSSIVWAGIYCCFRCCLSGHRTWGYVLAVDMLGFEWMGGLLVLAYIYLYLLYFPSY